MPANQSFTVTSPDFPNGGQIPRRYTCDDADISPELTWSGVPASTQSVALIIDDPDAPAGVWTYWLLWKQIELHAPKGVGRVSLDRYESAMFQAFQIPQTG
jgi:phosphatidylethanolamine-binding protein (PEBP) family uncharacterized protein